MSEKLCTNCIHEKVPAGLAPCINCSPITKNRFVLKHCTNADRIRSMSDEELYNWFWWMHKEMMFYTDSHLFVREWLEQEAVE